MIESQARTKQFVATGGTAAQSLNFPFANPDDLIVTATHSNGTVTNLVRGTHYNISGQMSDWRAGNGSFLPISIASGLTVRIERRTKLKQSYNPINGVELNKRALEGALDDAVMRAQDNEAIAVASEEASQANRDTLDQLRDEFDVLVDSVDVNAVPNTIVRRDSSGRVIVSTPSGNSHATTKKYVDDGLALKAPLASPALTGNPTAPTQPLGSNSSVLANTAFVQAAIAALVNSAPGALDTLQEIATALGNDPNFAATITNLLALKAPLASPDLTGNPTAPTQTAGNNSTRISTTAFVMAAITAVLGGADGNHNTLGKLADAVLLRAPLASPALTGNPTAPTQTAGDNSTRLANTAFVQAAIAALINSAPGALDTLQELADALGNDPNFATTITNLLSLKAALFSPEFTGNPTAPTQAAGNNSTRISTTAFVMAAISVVLGGADNSHNTLGKLATLLGGKLDTSAKATIAEAESGTNDTAYMTAKATAAAITALAPDGGGGEGMPIATQAEAEAGSSNAVVLTPVRGRQLLEFRCDEAATGGKIALRDSAGRLAIATATADNHAATKKYVDDGLALKAPLASPDLTGNPTAPTQTAGNNSTRLATTAFVQAAIAALINSAPGALDTLQELATALGNDPNFAATITNSLALKAPLASPDLTGNPTAPTQTAGNNSTRLATTAFVAAAVSVAIAALTKASVGLGNVDNTSDANKPLSSVAVTMFNSKLGRIGESFSGGYSSTPVAIPFAASITPALSAGHFRTLINSGAFTLIAPTGSTTTYTIVIVVTNAASGAGALTISGFNKVHGTFSTAANIIQTLVIEVYGAHKILSIRDDT